MMPRLKLPRTLREANPHAVYEIRPVRVYLPGAAIDEHRE